MVFASADSMTLRMSRSSGSRAAAPPSNRDTSPAARAATTATHKPTRSQAWQALQPRPACGGSVTAYAASSRNRGTSTWPPHAGQRTWLPACPGPTETAAEQRQGMENVLVAPAIDLSAGAGCPAASGTAPTIRPPAEILRPDSFTIQQAKTLEIRTEAEKKLAFREPQRHNVTSPGGFDTCRHVARILPGLPSLRRMAKKPRAIPSRVACLSRRGGSFPSPSCTAGLACPLNHTGDTPNSGRVSRHSIPAQAGRWIDLNVGIAKEL